MSESSNATYSRWNCPNCGRHDAGFLRLEKKVCPGCGSAMVGEASTYEPPVRHESPDWMRIMWGCTTCGNMHRIGLPDIPVRTCPFCGMQTDIGATISTLIQAAKRATRQEE